MIAELTKDQRIEPGSILEVHTYGGEIGYVEQHNSPDAIGHWLDIFEDPKQARRFVRVNMAAGMSLLLVVHESGVYVASIGAA